MTTPKVGDIIYVRTELHVYRGADDVIGGKDIVTDVHDSMSAGDMVPFVTVKSRPASSYNWRMLENEQEKLKERFGDSWAHAEPDMRPQFNNSEADWK